MSGKIASMKVQVSADTRDFDARMKHVRQQMRQAREASSMAGAAGFGATGGRLGAAIGMASLSPMMAGVTGAVTGLSIVVNALAGAVQQFRNVQESAARDAAAVIDSRMDPVEQMRMSAAAGVVSPGATSAELIEFLRGFKDDKTQMRLLDAGMTQQELAAVTKGTSEAAIRILADISRSGRGAAIGEALGGKAGVMFNQARFATPQLLDRAFRGKTDAAMLNESLGARRLAQVDAALGPDPGVIGSLRDTIGSVFESLFNIAQMQPAAITTEMLRQAGEQSLDTSPQPLATDQFSVMSAEANAMPAEVVQLLRESVAVQRQIRDASGAFN